MRTFLSGSQAWAARRTVFLGEKALDLRATAIKVTDRIPAKLVIGIWGALVLASLGYMAHYSFQAGVVDRPPTITESHLPFLAASDRYQLVMALHPKCPCSVASVGELTKIISRFHSKLDCVVLVYQPENQDENWADTSLVHSAELLPNTKIVMDPDGDYALRLGMSTSGSIILYSPEGYPEYYGGITSGRSHHGDNIGSDSVRAIMTGNGTSQRCSPVFGCPIHPEVQSSSGGAI